LAAPLPLDDATAIRRRDLETLELEEFEASETQREWLLNFVIVGAGPTGVELARAIGEFPPQPVTSRPPVGPSTSPGRRTRRSSPDSGRGAGHVAKREPVKIT
jgi:hypothetical protein